MWNGANDPQEYQEDDADCEKYGNHEWVRLTRHAEPGPASAVNLANVICERCSAMGFIDTDDDTCDGCSCSGDPEAEHGCGISPECRHKDEDPRAALAYEYP